MPRTKQFDKREVLHKAMELFWKKGYHATSIQDLVNHLGIHRGSMYDTFGDKEQLFQEALRFYVKENSSKFPEAAEIHQHQSIRSFFSQFFRSDLRAMAEDSDAKGCFLVNTTTELATSSPKVCTTLQANQSAMIDFFAQLIHIGQEKGEIPHPTPAKTLALQLFAFFNGLKVLGKVNQKPGALEAAMEAELAMLFGD